MSRTTISTSAENYSGMHFLTNDTHCSQRWSRHSTLGRRSACAALDLTASKLLQRENRHNVLHIVCSGTRSNCGHVHCPRLKRIPLHRPPLHSRAIALEFNITPVTSG